MTGLLTEPLETNRALASEGINAYSSTTPQVWGAYFGANLHQNPASNIINNLGGDYTPTDDVIDTMAKIDNLSPEETERLRAQIIAPKLTKEEANARYGLGGHLNFEEPISASEAARLRDTKREELMRNSVISRGQGGFIETGGGFAAGLFASALDPINIASAFIPVVGEGRYALWAAKYGKGAARFARGAAEGAVGAAVVEPIVLAGAYREQADYTAADSMMNIAFGTVLGGGLHMGGGWLGDKLAGRNPAALPAMINALPQDAKVAGLRGAVAAVAEGKPVTVAEVLRQFSEGLLQADRSIYAKTNADLRAATKIAEDLDRKIREAGEFAERRGELPKLQREAAKAHEEVAKLEADRRKQQVELAKSNASVAAQSAPTAVFDRATLLQNHTGADGRFDMGAAGDAVRTAARDALDAGGTVTLYVEGKPRKIVDVSPLGLKDENGNPWGIVAVMQPLPGDNARIEITSPQAGLSTPLSGRMAAPTPTSYVTPEDRQAITDITEQTSVSVKADEPKQTETDVASVQEDIAAMTPLFEGEQLKALEPADAGAVPRRKRGLKAAASCLLGL